ncbi:MAG: hypothetical protein ACLGHZ_08075 [Actinomycetes bacterium]
MNTLLYDTPHELTNETFDRLALGRLIRPVPTWRNSLQIALDVVARRHRAWSERVW